MGHTAMNFWVWVQTRSDKNAWKGREIYISNVLNNSNVRKKKYPSPIFSEERHILGQRKYPLLSSLYKKHVSLEDEKKPKRKVSDCQDNLLMISILCVY